MSFPTRLTALIATGIFTAAPARAVIVAGLDGTQNITAPADDFGFARVGKVYDTADGFSISGVYLGSGWMLSAYHGVRDNLGGFLFGPVVLSGISYSVNPSTAVRLQNADLSFADLAVFQLTAEVPGLGLLPLAATTPLLSASVSMMGNGVDRLTTETHWDVIVNPGPDDDTWTETAGAGTRQGYKETLGFQSLRWGKNNISSSAPSLVNDGFGITNMFRTTFNSGIADEAQGAAGDSGGGVFRKNGATWELTGIMLATGHLDGQPADTAVYGDVTYIGDVATYRTQLNSIVPEPSSAALLLLGAAALGARRRVTAPRT